ncbi:hypothetical protein Tco_0700107, partial [Tanacetum coccineum]
KSSHAKIFYIRKQKEPGKPKEEIYSNSKIVQVVKTYWELGHEHKFITEIVARRANDCIVSNTEPDYKNLNKNDIEDIYLLIINGKSSEEVVADDAGKKTNEEPTNEGERNGQEMEGGASNIEDDQNVQDFRAELDNLLVQQKECYDNNTNRYSTVSLSVSTAGQIFTNANDLLTDPFMLDLEDTADLQNTDIFSGNRTDIL